MPAAVGASGSRDCLRGHHSRAVTMLGSGPRDKGRAISAALKLRAPSVDFSAMPTKHHLGTAYASIDATDAPVALAYKITPHLGSPRPRWNAEAMDMLWHRLDLSRGDTSFFKAGTQITVTWHLDSRLPVGRDELIQLGRLTILEMVRDVCRRAPELELEWFAVRPV
jgi:hypothetical protein